MDKAAHDHVGATDCTTVRQADNEYAVVLTALQEEIENRLCSLRRIADSLKEGVENIAHPGPVFNLTLIETRARYIAAMKNLHAELQKLLAQVAKNGSAAEILHRDEIKTMQESLKRAVGPIPSSANNEGEKLDSGSATAASASRTVMTKALAISGTNGSSSTPPASVWNGMNAVVRSAAPRPTQSYSRTSIPIGTTDETGDAAISLEAITIPRDLKTAREILAAVTSQDLFYIPQWNHFAVRLGGIVFHANVARIYSRFGDGRLRARAKPERVRECERVACGRRSCKFYHDPEEFPDSKDVRNFTAESFVYSPPMTNPRGAGVLRRFGSIDHIEADVRLISPDEARTYVHQVSHDILCALVLAKYAPGFMRSHK